MFRAKRPASSEIPKPANGREFTPQERAQIAARYEQLAANFRREQRERNARDPMGWDLTEAQLAFEADLVDRAARLSNECLVSTLKYLQYLHR